MSLPSEIPHDDNKECHMKNPNHNRPDNGEDPAVTPKPAEFVKVSTSDDSGGNSPTPPRPPVRPTPED